MQGDIATDGWLFAELFSAIAGPDKQQSGRGDWGRT